MVCVSLGRLVEQVIAVLASVVFMMVAYQDAVLPKVDKTYTVELPPKQTITLESACGKQINCINASDK